MGKMTKAENATTAAKPRRPAKRAVGAAGAKAPTFGESLIADMTALRDALAAGKPPAEVMTARRWQVDSGPETFSAAEVRAIRDLTGASQPLFGQFLGIKASTLKSWEQGRNRPSGAAVRFLDEIRRNPEYFRARLAEMVRPADPPPR